MSHESAVLFVHTAAAHALIIRTVTRRTTQLVNIDPSSGALVFTFTPGVDVFASEADALDYLKAAGPVEIIATSKVVLGYVVIGPVALLLLADKLRTSAVLPGNHEVKTVATSKWHRIQLQQPEPDPVTAKAMRDEMDQGIAKTTSFPIDGAHFFCETLDLSRPFPSDHPVAQPSWEFVWNRWLSTGFRTAGLDFVCPQLLQGLCESRELHDHENAKYHLAIVSRRGRLHVGPRYKARGLNDYAEPGNEIECEQIIWRTLRNSKDSIPWSRYTWRRGSVPLWWGVSIKNSGIGEAEIRIRPHNTFQGSRRYVRRLQRRFKPNAHLDPDPPPPSRIVDRSLLVPLVFVSLLRKGTPEKDRSETKLASAYDFVVGALRKSYQLPLTYIALDWHELDRSLGHEGIVEAFWASVRSLLPQHGFALGKMVKVDKDWSDLANKPVTPDELALGPAVPSSRLLHERCVSSAGQGWVAHWYKQQRGLARYNCADSLDRTNVSSFFGAAQVFVEQCRELDIQIASTPDAATASAQLALYRSSRQTVAALGNVSNGVGGNGSFSGVRTRRASTSFGMFEKLGKDLATMMQEIKSPISAKSLQLPSPTGPNATPELPPLPDGWEAKFDPATQRIFYVDHNRKLTSWERPSPPPAPPASISLSTASSSAQTTAEVTPVTTPVSPLSPLYNQLSLPGHHPRRITEEGYDRGHNGNSSSMWSTSLSGPSGSPAHPSGAAATSPAARLSGAAPPTNPSVDLISFGSELFPFSPLARGGNAFVLGAPAAAAAATAQSLPAASTAAVSAPLAMMAAAGVSSPAETVAGSPVPSLSSIDAALSTPDAAGAAHSESKLLLRRLMRSGSGGSGGSGPFVSSLVVSDAEGSGDFAQRLWPGQPTTGAPEDATCGGVKGGGRLQQSADDLSSLMAAAAGSSGTATNSLLSASLVPPAARGRAASPRGGGGGASSVSCLDMSRPPISPRMGSAGETSSRLSRNLTLGADLGRDDDPELWEPLTPWCLLTSPTCSVKKFGRRVKADALSALAELFLVNGDMSAWLYTGSQAMHSERILIFEPESSKLRRSGLGSYGNSLIAIKRRYNNVLVDSDKQMQIEIFLGMKQSVYFPTLTLQYTDSARVPLEYPESDEEDVVAEIGWPVLDKGRSSEWGDVVMPPGANGPNPGNNGVSRRACRGKSYSTEKLMEDLQRSQTSLSRCSMPQPTGGLDAHIPWMPSNEQYDADGGGGEAATGGYGGPPPGASGPRPGFRSVRHSDYGQGGADSDASSSSAGGPGGGGGGGGGGGDFHNRCNSTDQLFIPGSGSGGLHQQQQQSHLGGSAHGGADRNVFGGMGYASSSASGSVAGGDAPCTGSGVEVAGSYLQPNGQGGTGGREMTPERTSAGSRTIKMVASMTDTVKSSMRKFTDPLGFS